MFRHGSSLTDAIKRVVAGKNVRMAVAFWGQGAPELLGLTTRTDWRLICNLQSGGCNPHVLRALEDPTKSRGGWTKKVLDHANLHAKVYLSDRGSVVCSANASANGLGLEGKELTGWLEAGVEIANRPDLESISEWFENLWKASNPISGDNLDEAARRWRERRGKKPPLAISWMIDPDAEDVPLVSWYDGGDYDYNGTELQRLFGKFDDKVRRCVDDGVDIEGDSDIALLTPGRWVLQWKRNGRRLPDARMKPEWVQLGKLARRAFRYKGERNWRDAVLASSEPGPEPIPIDTPGFVQGFRETISKPKYEGLRSEEYEHSGDGSFYSFVLDTTREFWREIGELGPDRNKSPHRSTSRRH